jgi:succinyl-CoA synthetase alpha subunit
MLRFFVLTLFSQATANVKESLEWGTKIVGGVKPGVEGEHLGLPIFPSVRVVSYGKKHFSRMTICTYRK